ncbi:unnamed protein product [Symbiodinium necroappetens]|nr:unnamed protein product [Symbiodinium necroappetens]|eukprot:CAMPEP_0181447130 /NCGR_PEP_ID=MMETSP1110-20121109/26464_1 /TAXON_ID=174948 /ORGANISM="Symbiodinium sp., Strain CCMP421" /LENGTH=210 /DNA_ID=CAMNT_0023571235 /DNA_START=95 /DNA_END=727 /DNA_ORIENTATION=-
MWCCCAAEDDTDKDPLREAGFVKAAPAFFEPDAIPDVFTVSLGRHAEGGHGVQMDVTDADCAIIKDVTTGSLAEWNKTVSEAKRVKLYDRVIEVNGCKGPSFELAKALTAETEVFSVTIQRPEERTVTLHRPGEIGVVLNYKKAGSVCPWISKISSGLLHQWNQATPEEAVHAHDRIVAVNGTRGAPEELMVKMKEASSVLELTILHYAV